ncbi:MAG TPA: (4Fe-4S)-binding protein [Gaiellaceae bacterium]
MSEQIVTPAREYATEEIVVEWRPSLCYHSRNCVAALPAVFDPQARPWVNVHAANTDAVEAAVAQCPSGALRSRKVAKPTTVVADDRAEVRVLENGPLLLRGHLRVLADDGTELAELERAALCRCGQSQNKPFCDGSHARVGFRG